MTSHTHQTAPTQFVEANGIRFAYRRFGKRRRRADRLQPAFPGHDGLLGSGRDRWPGQNPRSDPVQQRRRRPAAPARCPPSFQEMGANAIAFIRALGPRARSTCSASRSAAWSPRRSRCRRPTSCAS